MSYQPKQKILDDYNSFIIKLIQNARVRYADCQYGWVEVTRVALARLDVPLIAGIHETVPKNGKL